MAHGPRVTRRRVLRTGSVALATGVGAAALAACGETKVVTKEVPVEKTIVKEVPVEKIVKQTQIKEVPVEKIVTRNVVKTVEKMVEAVAERAPGIDIYNLDTSVAIDGKPWNPRRVARLATSHSVTQLGLTRPRGVDVQLSQLMPSLSCCTTMGLAMRFIRA